MLKILLDPCDPYMTLTEVTGHVTYVHHFPSAFSGLGTGMAALKMVAVSTKGMGEIPEGAVAPYG